MFFEFFFLFPILLFRLLERKSALAYLRRLVQLFLKPIFHCDAKTSCVWPWRWLSPPTPLFCVGDTNMLVSENAKIGVSPDVKPQHLPVEYRLRWVPGVGSLRWACTFHIFCVDFICVG